MPTDKLYVKVKCSMCGGTRVYNHSGYHNPQEPLKWKSCPYCDHNGLVLIEAAVQTIADYLNKVDEGTRQSILAKLRITGDE